MQYIFGYGSLICSDSRNRTGISGMAHPVEVSGIARRWSLQTPEWPATAVSAHSVPGALCNGVYFAVDQANLELFDQREMGYDRVEVEWRNVAALSDHALPTQGALWTYVGRNTGKPSQDKPIMQSYLDVIMDGCLSYGEDFACRFTQQTELWQHLIDDRHNPQYPRPLKDHKHLPNIDQILQSQLPDLWRTRTSHRHK
jgi:cation transport regulator ChaC